MNLFVTGGSGFIGSCFVRMALESGHQVIALTRPASAARVPAGARLVYGSLPFDLPEMAIEQADVVVHLAAITTADRSAQANAVNDFGTRALLAIAKRNSIPFIFISTQSAHADNRSTYAVTKRRGEGYVRESGIPWVIIRPGLVYGPGKSGLFGRMRRTVESLPVIPLLGGGKTLVQAIHVEDLCAGLLTIVANTDRYKSQELNLGDPAGVTMKEFLVGLATHCRGRSLKAVSIPVWPLKAVVSIGEKLRLPLPISMDNLRGLETVRRMETAESLQQLGLDLRPLDTGLAQLGTTDATSQDTRLAVVQVGAGKIGIVHALQVTHSSRSRLAAIVDPSVKAAALYKSMGFESPFYSNIDEAVKAEEPCAAIIATPANTHLQVAEEALARGLHILCEKPLSIDDQQAERWHELRAKYPDRIVQAGYMAAQFPHLLTAFHWLRTNKLGKLKKITAVALQTHIMSPEPVRWEMQKDLAGGGCLINFGCHVASILFRLVGWPDSGVSGWHWPIHSTEVEDSLAARFTVKSVPCTLLVSWAAPGFARPLNYLEIEGESAVMRIENYALTVTQNGETILLETQPDFPAEFNMSPDYTGAGFAMEHESFISSIENFQNGKHTMPGYMPPYEMAEALRLESWIRQVYHTLQFAPPDMGELVQWDIPLHYIHSLNGEEARHG